MSIFEQKYRNRAIIFLGLSQGCMGVSGIIPDPFISYILVGIGMVFGMLSMYFSDRSPFDESEDEEAEVEEAISHNEYMDILSEGAQLGYDISENGGTLPSSLSGNRVDNETNKDKELEKE